MLKSCHWGWILLPAAVLPLVLPAPGWGRENKLNGTLALRQEYDSNINLNSADPRSSWYSVIFPGLFFNSRGQTDKIEAAYNLGLKKNYAAESTSLDHNLLLRGENKISQNWQISALNRFYLSDDSDYGGAPVADVDRDLSARRERSRFSLNTFSTRSDYQYFQGSNLVIAYENRLLDSKTEGRDDFVRHHPSLSVVHKLDQQWQVEGRYGYINGDFDQADDLETHTGNLRLAHHLSTHAQLYADYGLNQTSYRGQTPDYRLHNINGGWLWLIDPQTNLTASAGQTILDRDDSSNRSFFNYSLEFGRRMQRGSISISAKGGIDEMQFSGGDEDGLSLYRQLSLAGSYQLLERLSARLGLSLRRNEFIDNPAAGRDRIFQASCGLSCSLTRQYEISTRYQYKELDVTGGSDGYQDHRVMVELKGSYDLWQW